MESVRTYKSQFHVDPNSDGPQTPISTPDFIYFNEARAREYGRSINVAFGEGFTTERPVGVKGVFDII